MSKRKADRNERLMAYHLAHPGMSFTSLAGLFHLKSKQHTFAIIKRELERGLTQVAKYNKERKNMATQTGLPSKEDFEAYEKVRTSGKTNMWDINKVVQLSKYRLDRETALDVMKHYTELNTLYPDVRK